MRPPRLVGAVAAMAAFACTLACAQPAFDPLTRGAAADDATLDRIRGGFESPAGLQVAFGIERAVYLNGNLVTTTSLNVAAGEAVRTVASGSLGLIQSGSSSSFGAVQLASGSATTVIQNSLDDQRIQGVSVVNATVNSLDLTKRADVQSFIQTGLTGSLRR